MATTKFNKDSMPFLANLSIEDKYTKVGLLDLWKAAELDGNPDTAFFTDLALLVATVGGNDFQGEDSDTKPIFTIRAEQVESEFGDGSVEYWNPTGIYGATVKAIHEEGLEPRLVLNFADDNYPVIQDGEKLTCGALTGKLKIVTRKFDDKDIASLVWSCNINKQSYYELSIPIKKGEDGNYVFLDEQFLDQEIIDSNNLAAWVYDAGGSGGGEEALKAMEVGIGVYKIVDMSTGRADLIANGETKSLFYAKFTLEDGRQAWANSDALKTVKDAYKRMEERLAEIAKNPDPSLKAEADKLTKQMKSCYPSPAMWMITPSKSGKGVSSSIKSLVQPKSTGLPNSLKAMLGKTVNALPASTEALPIAEAAKTETKSGKGKLKSAETELALVPSGIGGTVNDDDVPF